MSTRCGQPVSLEGLLDPKLESSRRKKNDEDDPMSQQPAHPDEVGLRPSLSAVTMRREGS